MAIINRASLGSEFYDVTSTRMLLAPEPQYVFAFLLKMALGSALLVQMPGALGITPDRAIPSTGAPASPWQAGARLMLASPDPALSQTFIVVPELGKAPGHTVRINRPRYGSGGFTLASREITSGTSISTVGIDLGSEQVTVTLKRYGGPYDSVNSNVAPFVLDKFDSSLGLHALVDYVGLHMQRDLDKLLDNAMSLLVSSGSTTLWPQAFSADNNSQVAGDMPMDIDLLFRGIETLKNANIPVFPNGRYRGFLSPTQARQLKNDPQFGQYVRYDAGMNPVAGIQGAFIGSMAGCDLFESTTLQATANAQSVNVTTGVMLGPGMVGAGVGQLPRVAASTDDNYGEHAKIVHLHYAGYSLMDNRFAVQLHSS